jgi:Fur family transcriptional regulator, ferric uptake regulator
MTETDLHNKGLKVTTARLRILQILETSKGHLRAEDIYRTLNKEGTEVGLATVYRVLGQFETAGIVKKHHFAEDHAVFELDRGAHHDHLVCVKCDRVDEFVDAEIEARQKNIAKQFGYEITDHSLYLYGICKHCQKHN